MPHRVRWFPAAALGHPVRYTNLRTGARARPLSPASSPTHQARCCRGVTVEATSPVLIEADPQCGHRRARRVPASSELRPRHLCGLVHPHRVLDLQAEGLELPPSFNATINAQLRIGAIEESVTVSGASPLVDTRSTVTADGAAQGPPRCGADGQDVTGLLRAHTGAAVADQRAGR